MNLFFHVKILNYIKICQDSKDGLEVVDQYPDEIIGDLDSIDPQILAFYKKSTKVKVTSTPNQDFTDFTKGKLAFTVFKNIKNQFRL